MVIVLLILRNLHWDFAVCRYKFASVSCI